MKDVLGGKGAGLAEMTNVGLPVPPGFTITTQAWAHYNRSGHRFPDGLWDQVAADLKPGDFVLMQFGHNDGGPLTGGRARASLKGSGDETKDVEDQGKKETEYRSSFLRRLRTVFEL